LQGFVWQRAPLPVAFFFGEGIEGRGNLGLVPDVGVEEVTESKELSDFLDGHQGRYVWDCFQVVRSGKYSGSH
jgi:hypothetical protein